jgi:hypothetical protein
MEDSTQQWTTTLMAVMIEITQLQDALRDSRHSPNLLAIDDLVSRTRGHLVEVKETLRDVRVHDNAAVALARARNAAGVAYARNGQMMVALAYFNANDPWGKFHDLPATAEGIRLAANANRNYGIASMLSDIPDLAGMAYMSLENSAQQYWQLRDDASWGISIILAGLSRSYKRPVDTDRLREAIGYLPEDSKYAAIGRTLLMPGRHTARGVRDAQAELSAVDLVL